MKKYCILVLIVLVQISFAQKKKTARTIPPPPKPELPKSYEAPENPIKKLIKSKDSLLAFEQTIDKDTIILPKEEFAEAISLEVYDYSAQGCIIKKSAVDTLKIKKEEQKQKGELRTLKALSFYEKREWCDLTFEKNILVFTNKETNLKIKFLVVLDKPKKEILYLESLDKKKKYFPTSYINVAPAPTIGY